MRSPLALLALVAVPVAAGAADDPKAVEFFEAKIRPVLVEQCYKCHSAASEKLKGGLRVDTRDGLLKGGSSQQPAVVPGDVDKSLLIKAIRYTDKDLQMPPAEKKLPDQQIADLEAWVKMGAPDPRTGSAATDHTYNVEAESAKKHWAFKPIKKPAVPSMDDSWIKTPVDAFILAALRDNKLTFAFRPGDTLVRGPDDAIATENALFSAIVNDRRILCAARAADRELLAGRGILAGPLIQRPGDEVIGMLALAGTLPQTVLPKAVRSLPIPAVPL